MGRASTHSGGDHILRAGAAYVAPGFGAASERTGAPQAGQASKSVGLEIDSSNSTGISRTRAHHPTSAVSGFSAGGTSTQLPLRRAVRGSDRAASGGFSVGAPRWSYD